MKEWNTKIRFGEPYIISLLEYTVNDVKIIICEKTWKSKYYLL